MENIDKARRKTTPKYSAEVRERAVRMVFEHRSEYATQWEAIQSIAAKMGCSRETLRNWVRQAESDRGLRAFAYLLRSAILRGLRRPGLGNVKPFARAFA
jgi:transposase